MSERTLAATRKITVRRILQLPVKRAAFPCVVSLFVMGFGQGVAQANDVYIAQNAGGSANGSSCANAYAVGYFNTPGNWTSGTPSATQIGPGTTLHLCGTFNAPAGASGYLQFQGGGTSGNPITLVAEPGTLIQAPYWGQNGAITSRYGYVVIDGNSMGMIQATANGTNLTYQAPSCGAICGSGIYVSSGNNITVRNWTIANIYVNVPPSDESTAGEGSYGIVVLGGSNNAVSGNTLHDMKWAVYYAYPGSSTSSNISVFNNQIYNADHGIAIGSGNTSAVLNGGNIYGNVIHDGANWDDNANNNHHDGVHLWAIHSGSQSNNVSVHNNYIYGQWGQHLNSLIYGEGAQANLLVYNNVLVSATSNGFCGGGILSIAGQGLTNSYPSLYNNTIENAANSGNSCPLFGITNTTGISIRDNIASTGISAIYMPTGSTFNTISNNLWYGIGSVGWNYQSGAYSRLSAWQTACSCDAGASVGAPMLDTNYKPQAGSPAIGLGANLTSLGISTLNFDMAGVTRPSTGAWDAGAYQFGGSTVGPSPPTTLTTQVH